MVAPDAWWTDGLWGMSFLVGGFERFLFSHILGMSSSQLTFIFFRGFQGCRSTSNQILSARHECNLSMCEDNTFLHYAAGYGQKEILEEPSRDGRESKGRWLNKLLWLMM